jgi:hypothetical protein
LRRSVTEGAGRWSPTTVGAPAARRKRIGGEARGNLAIYHGRAALTEMGQRRRFLDKIR